MSILHIEEDDKRLKLKIFGFIKFSIKKPKYTLKYIDKKIYTKYHTTTYLNTSVGFRKDTVVKVENFKLKEKENDILKETEIIKYLNDNNCISCPKLLSSGVDKNGKNYIILERINDVKKSPMEYPMGDLIFAFLEQKNLGVWHGDFNPENILFDGKKVVLIDYDQARIMPEIKNMNNLEFMKFIADDIETKWSGCLEEYMNVKTTDEFINKVKPYFTDNWAFKLGTTTLMNTQTTTISDTGYYHTIDTPELYIEGMRDLKLRKPVLDKINIEKGEKILDFGCNAGLLSYYLYDRGAVVSGCDMDSEVITAATMISHILDKKIDFFKCDIDIEKFKDSYDTICLFSVIHHTKNMVENAKYIASKCKRIIIECRLNESGEKPTNKGWVETSKWSFETNEELYAYLEKLFPGFKFENNYGLGDRERFIIVLTK